MDRIYTGFECLDKHLKICKGDLVVIGGRPAIGKTAFLISILVNLAKNNFKCKFTPYKFPLITNTNNII